MGERRRRVRDRTDEQILAHETDMFLLSRIESGQVRVTPELRFDLRRLSDEGCIVAGFGTGTTPMLLPRGARLLAAARGEFRLPTDGPA